MPPPGGTMTPIAVPPARMSFGSRIVDTARTLISSVSPTTWFGPMQPLPPVAPPEVKGRAFDYPTGVNLSYIPRGTEPVSFEQLRELAYAVPLLRSVIETRKDQVASLDWIIRPKTNGPNAHKTKAKVKPEDDPASQRVTAFFQMPDKRHPFDTWLRMVLEELFVTDAVTIEPRMDRSGKLFALDQIDGATIKPLIGQDGRRPFPPDPAYQQIIKGVPAADFTSDELIYFPRNPRVHSLGYGYSNVEQIILTINIALRRDINVLEYYKSGSIPDAFGTTPKEWTGQQIDDFQKYFDALMTGDLARRRGMKFMPGEFKLIEARQPPLKDQYDEWLARVVCFAFSVPITPFVNQVNRATGETLKLQATQEGLAPLKLWLKTLLNRAIWQYMGETSVEFAFDDEDEQDPLEQAQVLTSLVQAGIKNRNEARDELGMAGIAGGEEYSVQLGTGLVAITIPEEPPEPDPMAPGAPQPRQGARQPGAAGQGASPKGGKPKQAQGQPKPAAKGVEFDFSHTGRVYAIGPEPVECLPFNKAAGRRPGPLPFDRPTVHKAVGQLEKRVAAALRKTRAQVLSQLRNADLGKAAGDDDTPLDDQEERERWAQRKAQEVVETLDLSTLTDLADDDTTADLALDTVRETVAQLGVDMPEDLVDQVNDEAVKIAKDRAAELVGKRVLDDGTIIGNPNPQWAITDSTRDMIRDAIADGLADNIGRDQIIQNIEDLTGFDEDRATTIAITEIARANSQAALTTYQGARSIGVKVKKAWIVAPDEKVCDDCTENADAGPIDLDDDFPSGDDAPPGHPDCRCALSPVVEDNDDEGEQSDDDGEEA